MSRPASHPPLRGLRGSSSSDASYPNASYFVFLLHESIFFFLCGTIWPSGWFLVIRTAFSGWFLDLDWFLEVFSHFSRELRALRVFWFFRRIRCAKSEGNPSIWAENYFSKSQIIDPTYFLLRFPPWFLAQAINVWDGHILAQPFSYSKDWSLFLFRWRQPILEWALSEVLSRWEI